MSAIHGSTPIAFFSSLSLKLGEDYVGIASCIIKIVSQRVYNNCVYMSLIHGCKTKRCLLDEKYKWTAKHLEKSFIRTFLIGLALLTKLVASVENSGNKTWKNRFQETVIQNCWRFHLNIQQWFILFLFNYRYISILPFFNHFGCLKAAYNKYNNILQTY